jgi:hypothetical protein
VLFLIITTNDSTPSLSADEFHKLIFEDEVSLHKQYAACSFGKLNLVPSEYGILDLYLNTSAEGATPISLVSMANEALRERLGIAKTSDASDLLRSVYNDLWGGYTSSLLHEVGHGLGLAHANENGSDYSDYTSYMSAGHKKTNWPAKSFNAKNHWDLGWYEDRSVSVDPIEAPQILKIAAFVDYDKTQQGEYVIAEVGIGNLYMQYNRAKGFNRDTEEKADMLTISTKTDEGTDLVAGLDLDSNTYLVAGFEGSDQDILIEVCHVGVGNGADQPDYMIVSVGIGPSLCGQEYTPSIPSPTVSQERDPTEPEATDDTPASGLSGASSLSTTTLVLVILAVLSCLATSVLFVLRRRRASSKLESDSKDAPAP